mmetsp:Transcript_513/g.1204  ORF Transcript_513/g.1204 Transcript_513/m.1204 type:complete len:225 (-) Transcript_513:702-1376(-)
MLFAPCILTLTLASCLWLSSRPVEESAAWWSLLCLRRLLLLRCLCLCLCLCLCRCFDFCLLELRSPWSASASGSGLSSPSSSSSHSLRASSSSSCSFSLLSRSLVPVRSASESQKPLALPPGVPSGELVDLADRLLPKEPLLRLPLLPLVCEPPPLLEPWSRRIAILLLNIAGFSKELRLCLCLSPSSTVSLSPFCKEDTVLMVLLRIGTSPAPDSTGTLWWRM